MSSSGPVELRKIPSSENLWNLCGVFLVILNFRVIKGQKPAMPHYSSFPVSYSQVLNLKSHHSPQAGVFAHANILQNSKSTSWLCKTWDLKIGHKGKTKIKDTLGWLAVRFPSWNNPIRNIPNFLQLKTENFLLQLAKNPTTNKTRFYILDFVASLKTKNQRWIKCTYPKEQGFYFKPLYIIKQEKKSLFPFQIIPN